MLLLMAVLCFFCKQLGFSQPWNPPFYGTASLAQLKSQQKPLEVVVDPRGWEKFLKGELGYLLDPDNPRVAGKGLVLLGSASGVEPAIVSPDFSGQPRAAFRQSSESFQIEGELFDSDRGATLISGPVRVQASTRFLAPRPGPGVTLDVLRFLPPDVDRALLIDTRSVRLPAALKDALRQQLKRWGFDPFTALGTTLSSPLCYADWRGGSLLLSGIESTELFEDEIEGRFPRAVISTTAAWAAGTRIVGFDRASKPAWFIRGDYLVATPDGGVERLAGMLKGRFENTASFLGHPPLIGELERLSALRKGWHVCIIERSPESAIHWVLLLAWDKNKPGTANGYLATELRPTKEAKDSPF
jgi:hypothetical protein